MYWIYIYMNVNLIPQDFKTPSEKKPLRVTKEWLVLHLVIYLFSDCEKQVWILLPMDILFKAEGYKESTLIRRWCPAVISKLDWKREPWKCSTKFLFLLFACLKKFSSSLLINSFGLFICFSLFICLFILLLICLVLFCLSCILFHFHIYLYYEG